MRAFPAAMVALTLLFVAAAPLLLQGDPSSLRGTQVTRGIVPGTFEFEGHSVRFLMSRVPTLDPSRDVLLVLAPDVGYTDDEVASIRGFVFDGGRLLVAGGHGADKELLERLALGVYLTGTTLYTPVFQGTPGAMLVTSTGKIPSMPRESVIVLPVGVEGGESILRAPDPSWADLDGNGRPDLGEPIVSASIASVAEYGQGVVVVVGDGLLFHRAPHDVQRAFVDFLAEGDRVLVLDAAHRSAADPFGVSSLMAGAASVAARTAILISVIGLGAFLVLRPRFSKRAKATATQPGASRYPPELVSEVLSELDAR